MTLEISELPWLVRAADNYAKRVSNLSVSSAKIGQELSSLSQQFLDQSRLDRLGERISRFQAAHCDMTPLDDVHLGIVSNATTDFLARALRATGPRYGLNVNLTIADFGQGMQEALNPNSPVNSAKPDLILLALDHRGLQLEAAVGGDTGAMARVAIDQVKTLRENLSHHSGARIILQTLPRPDTLLFGGLDRRVAGTWTQLCDAFNHQLDEVARDHGDLVLDVAGLAETVGLANWHDEIRWNSAKVPFSLDFLPLYADHVCRLISAWRGKSRKVLVLDLDNTLWGGVIGDDGLEGIVIGQGDGLGESFLSVQKTAVALRERGIVLAVCSKNDDTIAREPFQKHPEMLLKESDFAAFVANWVDKASNLRAIAKILNLGLDSLVFLDDNPVERGQVRDALPEVAVPELPEDPSLYSATLLHAGYFETISFTSEDRARAAQYQANLQREQLKVEGQSIDDYLRSLDMKIQIREFDAIGRARITQLINKTNQFNLTTLRTDEAQVRMWEESPDFWTMQVRVIDKFGDNGIIGIVVARKDRTVWELPMWLMSCRVLNRRVEEAVLNALGEAAKRDGVEAIMATYIPTPKNGLVKEHYQRLGFTPVEQLPSGATRWRLNLADFRVKDVPFEVI